MTVEQWALAVAILNIFLGGGILGYLIRISYTWNTIQDRLDILWRQYCIEHNIPFKGLRNDFD